MRARLTWIALIVIGALVFAWWLDRNPAASPAPAGKKRALPPPPPITAQPPVAKPVVPPAAVTVPRMAPPRPLAQQLEVPIQDQATIDFSYGAPMVKSGGADAEAMERSLREMNAALKDLSVGPDGKKSPVPSTPTPAN
jgi:hypothetical protein